MKIRSLITTSSRFAAAALLAVTAVSCGSSDSESDSRDRNVGSTVPCASGGPCQVGDTGPGGGVVVIGATQPGVDIWEVAPVNGWGNLADAQILADELEFGGKSDWQLPNKVVLKAMYAEADRFSCSDDSDCATAFGAEAYWASSIGVDYLAPDEGLAVSFESGEEIIDTLQAALAIRPVRTFQMTPPPSPTTTTLPPTSTTSTIPSSQWTRLAVTAVSPVCSSWPSTEAVENANDNNTNTKYLCVDAFGAQGHGGIDFTLAAPGDVYGFKITTANDCERRDPGAIKFQTGVASSGPWSDAGTATFPLSRDRKTQSALVSLERATGPAPSRYIRMIVTARQNTWDYCSWERSDSTSVQFAEIELWGVSTAPSTTSTSTTTSTTSTTSTTTSTTVPRTTTTTAVERCVPSACRLGDVGPGGGTIVYDAGANESWGRFIELAPRGWSGSSNEPLFETWCAPKASQRVTLPSDIGSGATNTVRLVQLCSESAAATVVASRSGGKSDWVLPSEGDMVKVCDYVKANGDPRCRLGNPAIYGFSGSTIYSSTGTVNYSFQLFYDGTVLGRGGFPGYVRPVRYVFGASSTTTVAPTTTVRATTSTTTTIAPTTTVRQTTTTTTTPAPTRDPADCRRGGTCEIGDVGPGGGVVFYVAPSLQPWGQYIEVAPENWAGTTSASMRGLCSQTTGIGGTYSEAIGAGRANTTIMAAQCPYNPQCAYCGQLETRYRGNGFTDWYAPSIGEARAFYNNVVKTGIVTHNFATIATSNMGSNFRTLVTMNNATTVIQQPIRNEINYVAIAQRPVRAFRANTCANGGLCRLGDIGPGGGTIFYVGDFVNAATGEMQHYLELAPANWSNPSDPLAAWGCNTGSNAVANGLGEGEKNTSTIIASCSNSTIAAARARAYRGGGQTDWSLPSHREMQQLCLWATDQPVTTPSCQTYQSDANGIGRAVARSRVRSDLDWSGKVYWTSSQHDTYSYNGRTLTARDQNGSSFSKIETRFVSVRPIRSF